MKNNLIVLLLILTSCNLFNADRQANSLHHSINGFEFSQECQNICWLGINPGITSVDDTVAILTKADQINRDKLFQRSTSELDTIWFTDNSKRHFSLVRLTFEQNVVKSIQFSTLTPFTLGQFISMVGDPDQIIIEIDKTIDGGDIVNYAVYFPSQKLSLSVYPGNSDGPNPNDYVDTLTLNNEFTYPKFYKEEKTQPWLGYGHLEEYLPGQELPSGNLKP